MRTATLGELFFISRHFSSTSARNILTKGMSVLAVFCLTSAPETQTYIYLQNKQVKDFHAISEIVLETETLFLCSKWSHEMEWWIVAPYLK